MCGGILYMTVALMLIRSLGSNEDSPPSDKDTIRSDYRGYAHKIRLAMTRLAKRTLVSIINLSKHIGVHIMNMKQGKGVRKLSASDILAVLAENEFEVIARAIETGIEDNLRFENIGTRDNENWQTRAGHRTSTLLNGKNPMVRMAWDIAKYLRDDENADDSRIVSILREVGVTFGNTSESTRITLYGCRYGDDNGNRAKGLLTRLRIIESKKEYEHTPDIAAYNEPSTPTHKRVVGYAGTSFKMRVGERTLTYTYAKTNSNGGLQYRTDRKHSQLFKNTEKTGFVGATVKLSTDETLPVESIGHGGLWLVLRPSSDVSADVDTTPPAQDNMPSTPASDPNTAAQWADKINTNADNISIMMQLLQDIRDNQ